MLCRYLPDESHVEVGLSQQGVGVGIVGHEVAHVGLVDAEHAVVQGDEVVVVLMVDHMVDEAVIDGDVSVDEASALGFLEIDFEVSDPDHAMKVFEGVVDLEVHAGVYEDVFFQFDIILKVAHPFDVFFGDVAWAFAAETLIGLGGTHFFP